MRKAVSIFWFRRDLRLNDQAGLYHALKSEWPVLPIFIFDTEILKKLQDPADARVTFIYQTLQTLKHDIEQRGSSILIKYGKPVDVWHELLAEYDVKAVFANHDYEPYAKDRDETIRSMLANRGILMETFKDQVIFEKDEVIKDDGKPYTVFTPYKNKWLSRLDHFFTKPYPTLSYINKLLPTQPIPSPSIEEIGFQYNNINFPGMDYSHIIPNYARDRDFPAVNGTSRLGVHLRFGTVSIRQLVADAICAPERTWLNELIWREFYMMVLYQFPHTVKSAFRPAYDNIAWRDNETEFKAWCNGLTGYPLVDAGMRELNATGYMHNRVRMVTASFLSKHLLIDWRKGEAYFASKLLDYELASNVGGWQWAAGCGTDAAPYFRIFNPETQMKKFDMQLAYIKKWIPEYADFTVYPKPIIEHTFARERCLALFKSALG